MEEALALQPAGQLALWATLALMGKSDPCSLPVGPLLAANRVGPWAGPRLQGQGEGPGLAFSPVGQKGQATQQLQGSRT